MTISAVVVFHSDTDMLLMTIESLVDQVDEMIVVDTSEDQGAAHVVRDRALLIAASENRGYGWACNKGIARASGDRVLVSNADVSFDAGAIGAMSAALVHRSALVAPVQRQHGSSSSPWAESLQLDISVAASLNRWLWVGRRRSERAKAQFIRAAVGGTPVTIPDHLTLSGAVLMARAEDWRSIGGFDEDFFLYQEDAELTMRARESGMSACLVPSASVEHVPGSGRRGLQIAALSVALHSERLAWSKRRLPAGRILTIQLLGIAVRATLAITRQDWHGVRTWCKVGATVTREVRRFAWKG